MSFPWPPGSASGIGSLPGTDPSGAIALVLGEVPDIPYLPELPERGFGADLIAHGCALLLDLPVEWQPHGWTLSSHPGRDLGRARDHLQRDLDILTEQAQGLPLIKVQVAGPLTMAANLELPNLHKVLTDPGAFRDLTQALTEGVRTHLADLAGRLPGTGLLLQVDEPSLPQVLAGQVPTPSGYGTVRALESNLAEAALRGVLELVEHDRRVVHCCAPDVPLDVIAGAGAGSVSLDAALLRDAQLDDVGTHIEAGGALWLGVIPGTDADISAEDAADRIRRLWRKLGFPAELLPERVVVTPSCGLAGASKPYVRRTMTVLRELGSLLREEPD